jgi:hypothetical protein
VNIATKGLAGNKLGPRLRDWKSKLATGHELLKVADVLGLAEEDLLTRMFAGPIAEGLGDG